MQAFIGCSGWFYWHWQGRFYPKKVKPSKWLEFYARKFNAVEVNSSFYHWPKPSNLKRWQKLVPKNFKFILKANKEITHIRRLRNVKKLINEFLEISSCLEEHFGCILFQLPPSYKFSKSNLEKLKAIPEGNAIEFRHASWFKNENLEIMKEFMKENRQIFCIVDAPNLPLIFLKTASNVYIRFHGRERWYSYNYNKEELQSVADKIKKLRPRNLFAFFNNDYNAYAPKNALEFGKLFK